MPQRTPDPSEGPLAPPLDPPLASPIDPTPAPGSPDPLATGPLDYQARKQRRRNKSNRDFWRAAASLWPYRRTVAISVICAVLTGAFTAGGLMTLMPLVRILVSGGTLTGYVDEMAVESSYGATLDRDGSEYTVRKLEATPAVPTEPAAAAPAVGARLTATDLAALADARAEQTPAYLRGARALARRVPADPVWAIATMFGFVVVLGVLGSTTRFFQEYLSETTAIRAINDIRRRLYDHMLRLPMSYYTRFGTSDLTARLVADAMGLQEGFKTILGKAVQEPITATFALGVAMWIDWRLTIFVIVFTPVIVGVIRKLGKKVRRAMRAALERNADMLGQIESTFVGIRVVKSAGAEPFERRRYSAILERLRLEQNRMAKYDAWSTPMLEMLGLMAAGCVLIFATWLVFRHKSLDPEQLITLMICLVAIAEPLRRISKLNTVLQKGGAAATRIFEIFAAPIEVERRGERAVAPALPTAAPPVAPRTPRRAGNNPTFAREIAFEGLTFTYPNTAAPALLDVNLRVAKGTSVAIVGRNGSGKTTLLSLLPRFFEPDRGRIAIDGVDVRDWPLRRLRRLIGIVTQEAILFPGTIAQNIAYADPLAPHDRVLAAADRAHAADFIRAKPGGFETSLDGLGGQLSGGQRQRVNIARAILRDTPILVLDEATSQVDAESEHQIQGAIAELMRDRTTFVIAHRFSTILNADVIVVMDAGRIVGTGTHDELLETCETYRQLYERQLVS